MRASDSTPQAASPPTMWASQVLEGLWLAVILLIPIVFAPPGVMIESIQIVKVTLFRTLVGLMAVVWVLEWTMRRAPVRLPGLDNLGRRLRSWLKEQPTHWVLLAAVVFFAMNLVSTLYSASVSISVWGKVPGMDGYGLYNTASYLLLFFVIATRLRTQRQLWRLLGSIAIVGVIVGAYGILQALGLDPFSMPRPSGRIQSSLGNPVFAAAVVVLTIPVTLGWTLARMRRSNVMWQGPVWLAMLAVQLWMLALTLSRGGWLGLLAGLLLFAGAATMAHVRSTRRLSVALITGSSVALVVMALSVNVCATNRGTEGFCSNPVVYRIATLTRLLPGESTVVVERPVLVEQSVGEGTDDAGPVIVEQEVVLERPGNERLLIWSQTLDVIANRPGLEQGRGTLAFLQPIFGYGPELFRYVFPLGGNGVLQNTRGGASYAHNLLLHSLLELGVLGLLAHAALLVSIFVAGSSGVWRLRGTEGSAYRWVLVALLAALGGWVAQGMVGLPRISDLVVFWVLGGLLVALPRVFKATAEPTAARMPGASPRRQTAQRARSSRPGPVRARVVVGLAVVALLVGVTWTKNVNYAWASMRAQDSAESFERGQYPTMVEQIDAAIALAPDVPTYQVYKAKIYAGAIVPAGSSLDPMFFLEQRYLAAREAVQRNPWVVESQRVLAEAAWALYSEGQEDKLDEAIRHYQALVTLMPSNYTVHNALAEVSLNSGRPEEALRAAQDSLDITWGPDGVRQIRLESGWAFYLQGLAYQEIGDDQRALASLEQGLLLPMDEAQITHATQVVEELRGG